ncbi:Hypothetical predicted protein [Mytilus galloprovincialis]|uniref:EGF-like domain-containing protein n=1 Tax=Mytilus galloprovincialis TaxID=29158 RepID=A0A8B6FAH3_MYTGA|nr:Hypothetical predicted protein [Mytilus galloprovincialis]
MVSQLDHGNITVSHQQLIPPDVGPCSHDPLIDTLPCGNFTETLPYNVTDMSWIYITVTYIQPDNYYGYDYIKLYVMDNRNSSSEVVTIQVAIMESPCQNKGACQAKNTSNYPCEDTHRAESFDLYYDCECPPEFIGLHCEEDVDECLSKSCQDSYTCTNKYGGYDCSCPDCGLATWTKAVIGLSVVIILIIAIIVIVYWRIKKRYKPIDDDLVHRTGIINKTENTNLLDKTKECLGKNKDCKKVSRAGINNEKTVVKRDTISKPRLEMKPYDGTFDDSLSDLAGTSLKDFKCTTDKQDVTCWSRESSTLSMANQHDNWGFESEPNDQDKVRKQWEGELIRKSFSGFQSVPNRMTHTGSTEENVECEMMDLPQTSYNEDHENEHVMIMSRDSTLDQGIPPLSWNDIE